MSEILFANRRDAGRALARALAAHAHRPDTLVLALPRGGVPLGFEVAQALGLPLDVFIVRKLGLPGWQERAMGALASGGLCVLDEDIVRAEGVSPAQIKAALDTQHRELARREALYRANRPPLAPRGQTLLLVDDGLATGATMRAAVRALRSQQPARIVVAVPVAGRAACDALRSEADAVVSLAFAESLRSVGEWYGDFTQTTDEQVRQLLGAAQTPHADLIARVP